MKVSGDSSNNRKGSKINSIVHNTSPTYYSDLVLGKGGQAHNKGTNIEPRFFVNDQNSISIYLLSYFVYHCDGCRKIVLSLYAQFNIGWLLTKTKTGSAMETTLYSIQ